MRPGRRYLARCVPIACLPLLPAQTYVVAAGGGGQFTEVSAAIQAVPDGSTLHVKAGNYGPFSIQGKSLTILAEAVGTSVVQAWGTTIQQLTAGQQVMISGLVFENLGQGSFTTVSLKACAGGVLLDRVATSGIVLLSADQCTDLHLLGCTFPDTPGFSGPRGMPTTRITALRSSLEIAHCSVEAGSFAWYYVPGSTALRADQGSFVCMCGAYFAGAREIYGTFGLGGGDSVALDGGSSIDLYGLGPFGAATASSLVGGAGAPPPNGGKGGDGLSLRGGSLGRVRGAALKGGSGAAPALDGSPVWFDASSKADLQEGAGPSAFLTGTMGANQLVKLSLRALPGSPAALMLGTKTRFSRPAWLALGAIHVQANQVLEGFVVPSTGLLEIPVQLPATWPRDSVVLAQFLTVDAARSEVQASNSFAAVTR